MEPNFNFQFRMAALFIILITVGCQRKAHPNGSETRPINWVQTDYGYKEYIDANKNEFWLFGSEEWCRSEVNGLIRDIEALKAKAKKLIESDYKSGDIVKEFISFHNEELGLQPRDFTLWEFIKPVNRTSLHPETDCTDPYFLIMDFAFYQSTDYVLGVYFNAEGEITSFAMES